MNRISTALLAALLLSGSAYAQHRGHVPDRHEKRQDVREVRDDRRDLAELEDVLAQFDRARARRSEHQLAAVDSRLRALLREELHENRVELAKEKAEARRSERDVRHADNRWERRESVREAREDRRDVRVASQMLEQRQRIARELASLAGRMHPTELNRKRALIVELIDLARRELRESQKEVREHHRR